MEDLLQLLLNIWNKMVYQHNNELLILQKMIND